MLFFIRTRTQLVDQRRNLRTFHPRRPSPSALLRRLPQIRRVPLRPGGHRAGLRGRGPCARGLRRAQEGVRGPRHPDHRGLAPVPQNLPAAGDGAPAGGGGFAAPPAEREGGPSGAAADVPEEDVLQELQG